MKKVIALALTLAMAVSLVACSTTDDSSSETQTDAKYKTGVGAVVSVKPTDENAETEKGASAQISTTIVAATFDGEGKVVSATIDVAQQTAKFDMDGQPDGEVDLRTKNEKGPDYGMAGISEIGKEINEQHEALANYWVGKTVEECVNMPTYERDEEHTAVPDVEDLKSSVTVTVGDYLEALQKAYDNAVESDGVVAKTGLGIVPEAKVVGEDAATEKGASFQMDTSFIVVALDENDTVLAASLDVAQQKVAFDMDGKVSGETDLRTKNEKGPDYGMAGISEIGKEINEQHKAFTDWMVGKTVAEIEGMETYERDEEHTAVPAVEDLKSSVTVTVGSYLEAFTKAVANAK